MALAQISGFVDSVPEIADGPRENVTPSPTELEVVDLETLQLLEECVVLDRLIIDRMIGVGLLSQRSREELDDEFESSLGRHGMVIRS